MTTQSMPHIKITQSAYQQLRDLAAAFRKAGDPRSLQSLASEAILEYQSKAKPTDQYILLSFPGLAREDDFPELLVCPDVVSLVRTMREQGHRYTEVIRVLRDGSTERLGNDPKL